MATLTMTVEARGDLHNNFGFIVVVMGSTFEGLAPNEVRARIEVDGRAGTWIWTVFEYRHLHSDAPETLAVVSGAADLERGRPGRLV